MISLPKLYAILDDCSQGERLIEFALQLQAGGCKLMQYRNKSGDAREMLADASELKRVLDASVRLIMNDRADLAVLAQLDGVHLGQDDVSTEGARKVIGPDLWLGVSTHNPEQVEKANQGPADYIAIGPVFGTLSKTNPDPVIGLGGVRDARRVTGKPLVAIGGIMRANCEAVMDAGADCVAVISDLSRDPQKSAEEFLRLLG
ncbi:MAG: thiamine phosphate synthase [Acidobacteria bacterium]|jgi:thiamine-phosphate pyrophosphorylase|nr:MAG: thiamine phosphate synthase [Acidobacteriota bacterium]